MKSPFRFNKEERKGVFFLLALIVTIQVAYYVLISWPRDDIPSEVQIDPATQAYVDSVKESLSRPRLPELRPFNPNFISDYKGYLLGMRPEEIDRLHAFRDRDRYVATAEEFQEVTQISDSLLLVISPYFRFPKWTNGPKNPDGHRRTRTLRDEPGATLPKKDLNLATADDLRTVKGIGGVLSQRIVKFRDALGGFLIDAQLFDVYGLDPEVARRTLVKFNVTDVPEISKININTADTRQLTRLVYISRELAENIVSFRENNGPYVSLGDLAEVPGFPVEKIDRIALYLQL